MCLTCHLNWSLKLQVSSKGSACNTFGSSHMCCVSQEEEEKSSLIPQLLLLSYLEAASPGSMLPGWQPGCLPNLNHVLLEGERRKLLGPCLSTLGIQRKMTALPEGMRAGMSSQV